MPETVLFESMLGPTSADEAGGLKPVDFLLFAARLKLCPDTKRAHSPYLRG